MQGKEKHCFISLFSTHFLTSLIHTFLGYALKTYSTIRNGGICTLLFTINMNFDERILNWLVFEFCFDGVHRTCRFKLFQVFDWMFTSGSVLIINVSKRFRFQVWMLD